MKRKLDEDAHASANSTKKPPNLDLLLRLSRTNPGGDFVLAYGLPELLRNGTIKEVKIVPGGIEITVEKASERSA